MKTFYVLVFLCTPIIALAMPSSVNNYGPNSALEASVIIFRDLEESLRQALDTNNALRQIIFLLRNDIIELKKNILILRSAIAVLSKNEIS